LVLISDDEENSPDSPDVAIIGPAVGILVLLILLWQVMLFCSFSLLFCSWYFIHIVTLNIILLLAPPSLLIDWLIKIALLNV